MTCPVDHSVVGGRSLWPWWFSRARLPPGAAWKEGYFSKQHVVPSVVNLTYKEASTQLSGTGFTVSINNQVNSATVPANEILSQTPLAGAKAKSGTVIDVTVSKGRCW